MSRPDGRRLAESAESQRWHETRRTSSGSLCDAPMRMAGELQRCTRLRHGLDLHPGASLNPLSHKHLRTRAEKDLVEAIPEYRQRLAQLKCLHKCPLRSRASAPRTSRSPLFRARERQCRSTWLVPAIAHPYLRVLQMRWYVNGPKLTGIHRFPSALRVD